MMPQVERFIKQAVVDADSFVASSALLAGIRLFDQCPEVVRCVPIALSLSLEVLTWALWQALGQ